MKYGMINVKIILGEINKIRYLEELTKKEYKKRVTPYVIILLSLRKEHLPERFIYSYSEVAELSNLTKGQVNRIVVNHNLERRSEEKKNVNVKKNSK